MTDEQRKRENAVTMARAVCDILDVIEIHQRHVERVCARYKDEPAFWEHMRDMGRHPRDGKIFHNVSLQDEIASQLIDSIKALKGASDVDEWGWPRSRQYEIAGQERVKDMQRREFGEPDGWRAVGMGATIDNDLAIEWVMV